METGIIMSEKKITFSPKNLPLKSFQTFADMRSNGDLCDVTFTVEDMKISAHRLVLATNIPYFHAMFLNNMAESNSPLVTLEKVDPNAFESLIYFAYNCELEISDKNVESLLVTAEFLQMDEVSDACCQFILEGMQNKNVLGVREFAVTHNLVKLKKIADEYVQKHFVEISCSEEFLELSFQDIKELLGRDDIHVPNEETVYQAAVSWVKSSLEDREDKLPELLAVVRMPFLSYQFLSACVASEELIQKSNACLKLLHEAKDRCILSDRSLPCSFATKPRNFISCKDSSNNGDYIYAVCRLENWPIRTVVERYDCSVGKWQMMNSKTICVVDAAVVVLGRKLYVIGGCNSIGRILNTVLVFDSESNSWSKIASLQDKKMLVTAVGCSNRIYVCGGRKDNTITDDVECYSLEKNEWKYIPCMLNCRIRACSVSLNEYIYVLGGRGGPRGRPQGAVDLSSVEMYNAAVEQWTEISPLSTASCLCSAASLNGKIYLYGNKFIEVYDPWLGEWDRISETKNSKSEFTLLAFSNKLYAVAGSNSSTVDIYDPETDEWSEGESLPEQLHFIAAGIVSPRQST